MNITDKYVFFWDGPWSNWATSPFQFEGMTFNCVEQWMMYHKATVCGDEETAKEIMATKSPMLQKELGRLVKNYNEALWSKVRYDIVKQGIWLKVTQNPEFKKQMLEDYGDGRIFVEASPTDPIWGINMGERFEGVEDEKNWKGLNLLGKALTEVAQILDAERAGKWYYDKYRPIPAVRTVVIEYEDHIWSLKGDLAQRWLDTINVGLSALEGIQVDGNLLKDFPFDKADIRPKDKNQDMSIGLTSRCGHANPDPPKTKVDIVKYNAHSVTGEIHEGKIITYL